jgi:hypothetical protein
VEPRTTRRLTSARTLRAQNLDIPDRFRDISGPNRRPDNTAGDATSPDGRCYRVAAWIYTDCSAVQVRFQAVCRVNGRNCKSNPFVVAVMVCPSSVPPVQLSWFDREGHDLPRGKDRQTGAGTQAVVGLVRPYKPLRLGKPDLDVWPSYFARSTCRMASPMRAVL